MFPILIRECSGVKPVVYARYGKFEVHYFTKTNLISVNSIYLTGFFSENMVRRLIFLLLLDEGN